jgi:drug/metabolite transporter (DMT)-like permease
VTVHENRGSAGAAVGAGDVQARLMLVGVCLIWGITWPVMRIALNEISPLSMRASTAAIGTVTMLVICFVTRRSLRLRFGRAWLHAIAASLLNVVAFSLLSAFAQIETATSRVAILTYTMPIWAVLLAWAVLGERPTRVHLVALGLCAVGLAVLISPLAQTGVVPVGVLLAVGSGFSWAAGTVYLKWARVTADPMGFASWQITIAFFVIASATLIFEGGLHLSRAHTPALLAVAFSGIAGNALAYSLWFGVVRRVSAVTASLGTLATPVIGVVATVLALGERPGASDIVGFAFIFTASACVVFAPWLRGRTTIR